MSNILGFPTPQNLLSTLYELEEEVKSFAGYLQTWTRRSALGRAPEETWDLLFTALMLLNCRRRWDNARQTVLESLITSRGRIESGQFSVAQGNDRSTPVVLKNGMCSPGLADHWVFAEKDWADLTLTWTDINYSRYFGYTKEELIGRRVDEVFGADHGPQLLGHDEDVQATMEAKYYRELVSVRGALVFRYAVRFPIFTHDDLRRLMQSVDDKSRLFIHPIGIACIAWDAAQPIARAI